MGCNSCVDVRPTVGRPSTYVSFVSHAGGRQKKLGYHQIKDAHPSLGLCLLEPDLRLFRMSESSCARRRVRSSIFIVSESPFAIRSQHYIGFPKHPTCA